MSKEKIKNVAGKGKGFIAEFRDFALKGNVMDMAIGVIIGAAFQKIITAVIDDLINPIIGLIFKVDLTNLYIPLLLDPEKKTAWDAMVFANGGATPTLADAKAAGFGVWAYGDFITVLINFLLLAFTVFLMVKLITSIKNKAQSKFAKQEAAAPTTKVCPFCREEIAIEATRCPHCTSVIEPDAEK